MTRTDELFAASWLLVLLNRCLLPCRVLQHAQAAYCRVGYAAGQDHSLACQHNIRHTIHLAAAAPRRQGVPAAQTQQRRQ